MYKLVVSGFDNVLINKEEAISASTILEIDRIRNKGLMFAIFSDRPYKDILEYNKDFSFVDYIISSNGACLYNVNSKEVVFEKNLDISILECIIKQFNKYNIYVVNDKNRMIVREAVDTNVYMVEIECNSKKKVEMLLEEVNSLNLNIKTFIRKVGKQYYLQIVNSLASVEGALSNICKSNKINFSDIVAIFGEEKDVLEFSNVGYKVATSNAPKVVKEFTDKTTSSNDNKGVKKILSYLFK